MTLLTTFLRRQRLRVLQRKSVALRKAAEGKETRSSELRRLSSLLGTLERVEGIRLSSAQLMAALSMLAGRVVELATGEGKTHAIALAAAALASNGRQVRIMTSNPYLAERDVQRLRPFYEACGLSVAALNGDEPIKQKVALYRSDILYGACADFIFDYLRDHFGHQAQPTHGRCDVLLVDEADAALIDGADSPYIVAGNEVATSAERTRLATRWARCFDIRESTSPYFIVDDGTILLTEEGFARAEELAVSEGLVERPAELYRPAHLPLLAALSNALYARLMLERDRDYIVEDDKVIPIDRHTGRKQMSRHWADGLHQAVEDKEGIPLSPITDQPKGWITVPQYARLYKQVGGATGTAINEEHELESVYGCLVDTIPSSNPNRRRDHPDLVFRTGLERDVALLSRAITASKAGRPVLIGTQSPRRARELQARFAELGVDAACLDAHAVDEEVILVAKAGEPCRITITTPVGGRGTDILLGGPSEEYRASVVDAGGLLVLGDGRSDNPRVDQQLQGRAGRKGDPGDTQFYISLEDKLLEGEPSRLMRRVFEKLPEGVYTSHSWFSEKISKAQEYMSNRYAGSRLVRFRFDSMAATLRSGVYAERHEILNLDADALQHLAIGILKDSITRAVYAYLPTEEIEPVWDLSGLRLHLREQFSLLEGQDEDWESFFEREPLLQRITQHLLNLVSLPETEDLRDLLRQEVEAAWSEWLEWFFELSSSASLVAYAGLDTYVQARLRIHQNWLEAGEKLRDKIAATLAKSQKEQD